MIWSALFSRLYLLSVLSWSSFFLFLPLYLTVLCYNTYINSALFFTKSLELLRRKLVCQSKDTNRGQVLTATYNFTQEWNEYSFSFAFLKTLSSIPFTGISLYLNYQRFEAHKKSLLWGNNRHSSLVDPVTTGFLTGIDRSSNFYSPVEFHEIFSHIQTHCTFSTNVMM